MRMKLVELFCGTGGFSRGAHLAGFEVAAAYDVDPILTSSFPVNFPNTKVFHRDVSALSGHDIERDIAGNVFGLFGGPPCQGFSMIGKRDNADPRRKLLWHFFRLVGELQPSFFIMENVQGLAYGDARLLLSQALDLVSGGYDISGPHIWNAADFGAATIRNRVFVIGVRKDLLSPFDIDALEARRRPPATVRQALADLERVTSIPASPDLPGFDRWKITRRGTPTEYARVLRSPDLTFTGHVITNHTPEVVARFAKVRPGSMDKVGRYPRLKLTGQCPTLRAGTGPDRGSYQAVRPIHPVLNRVITVREAARLQGFPDHHVFHPSIWHSFRMIGNSVSPVMSEAVFSAMRDALQKSVGASPIPSCAKQQYEFAVAAE